MELTQYFQSYKDYFWEWTTDEDVPDDTGYNENNLISIPNVGAIAYRPYIIEVLKQLQPQGLPPFGSLLLLLYATQEGYLNLDGILYHLKRVQLNYINVEKLNIHEGIKFLENLRALGNKYKKGQNKIILLQTVFAHSPVVASSVNSNLMLRIYAKKSHIIAESANKNELQDSVIIKDIRTLAILGSKFPTTESIIKAMQNDVEIPDLKDEVIEEETTVETDKDFIQQLIEEPKTFQIGSLIKRIWSGLKIPMRHLSPGEQPIGGISDMTNKGDFHRMLLSEYANEDEVFMNRVANNEALYIQREIPPEENIFERIILIDTSLKNWGTPKVLAFASAIAVIKHPKAHSECKVFALGQTNVPISLDKVDEVVENLNQVSPVLEVSHALEKFFNEEHRGKDLEVFFITNQENLAHQNLQKVIHENRYRLKFLVTTSSEGELNFYKHHKGTRKHIQKMMLPLKELWANPPKRKIRIAQRNQIKTDIPKNYSLLFPTPKDRICTFLYEGEFYILSNKKQLLKTYLSDNYYNKNIYQNSNIQRGCEVVIENISIKPRGQFALAKNKKGDYILAQYQRDKKLLSKLNLNTKEYSELNITGYDVPLDYCLLYFNKSFYLHEENSPIIFKINIEGNLSIEQVKNEDEIYKNDIKIETEIDRLREKGTKILNNFTKIGINDIEEFVISNFALEYHAENVYYLGKNLQKIEVLASQNKNKFAFEDGSEVITDHRGMLAFKSSNKNIPTFYMPSVHYGFMALATEKEFGGSEYYLPKDSKLKIREMDEMYSDYMKAFIKHILEYGT